MHACPLLLPRGDDPPSLQAVDCTRVRRRSCCTARARRRPAAVMSYCSYLHHASYIMQHTMQLHQLPIMQTSKPPLPAGRCQSRGRCVWPWPSSPPSCSSCRSRWCARPGAGEAGCRACSSTAGRGGGSGGGAVAVACARTLERAFMSVWEHPRLSALHRACHTICWLLACTGATGTTMRALWQRHGLQGRRAGWYGTGGIALG